VLLAVLVFASAAPAPAATPKVPDIVLGPDTANAAKVDAPIAEVTVYSDRARVRRRGRATIKGATSVIRLPDLPGGVFIDTIRVAATGGRVLRVEATPIERERLEIEQAGKLLDELDAVNDRLDQLADRVGVDEWEVGAVTRFSPASPVSEEKREGRKGLTVDVPSWWKALDYLGERANVARLRLARVVDERRLLEAERDKLRADVVKFNQGGFSDRLVQVIAVLEPSGGASVDLELEYFVPGAKWKPAYNLYFSTAKGQLTMETVAVVEQATGEDWPRAALLLSTATPGRGIDLPELLTWTLGERSEFVPRLRPRRPPQVEPLLPMPAAVSAASEAHAIASELVRERLARAASGQDRVVTTAASTGEQLAAARRQQEIKALVADAVAPEPTGSAQKQYDFQDEEGYREEPQALAVRQGSARSAPAARRVYLGKRSEASGSESAPVAAPAAAVETTLPWQDIVAVPRKASKSSAPYVRTWSVPMSLVDATTPRRPPTFSDPYLPAVSGGGLDYVYRAPTAATIESSGKQVRVPLASQTFRTSVFYEATPALATTAFLRARVRNDGTRPLLRGPATIFGDGEFVGIGEIKTTGPSGDIEFPLGADQDIRLVRQIVPSSKTTGMIMKDDETVYDVQLQVGNYKKQAVTVEVIDQVPKSRNEEIEVKLLATDPAPSGSPDVDGVIRWRVTLQAGETRTLKLRYQIKRPKDWRLYQR
jgi:hypothetical protein